MRFLSCSLSLVFLILAVPPGYTAQSVKRAPLIHSSPSPSPFSSPSPLSSSLSPPLMSSLVSAKNFKKMVEDREILASADLEENKGGGPESRVYSFHSAMLVRAGLERTRRIMTDYQLYSKLVPYVDRTDYAPLSRILDVEGGIWKFHLHSFVQFTEKGDRWIHYRIVGGHFAGLEGNIYFESFGEKGTLVYMEGRQVGDRWPPKFVITRGAEIVFGFTAMRMRNYLESNEKSNEEDKGAHDPQIPQPRNHL